MSTPITEEDLRVAAALMLDLGYGPNPDEHRSAYTAIAQALADRAATAHTEGRREAFGEALEVVSRHLGLAGTHGSSGVAAASCIEMGIRSARDRGMAGKP